MNRTPLTLLATTLLVTLTLAGCGSGASKDPAASGGGGEAGGQASKATINGFEVSTDPEAAAMLPEQYAEEIRIVTSAPYPPFEVFDADQKLVGLDIDLGDMIAAKLSTTTKWESIDYNGIIPALQAAKYDMVLASIGDTPEREKALDFVNYSKQGQVLLVPAGNPENIKGLESMCGKTLAVEAGNVTEGYFAEIDTECKRQGAKPMTVRELPKTSDALLAVKSGGAEAQYIGVATAADLETTEEGAGYDIITPADKPFGYLPRYVGVGLPKGSTGLRDAVQAALESLLADGTIAKLYAKYGQEQILIDKIVWNTVEDEPLL